MADKIEWKYTPKTKEEERLRQALNWLLHLHYGVGKDGGPPSDAEWVSALEFAKSAMGKLTDGEL